MTVQERKARTLHLLQTLSSGGLPVVVTKYPSWYVLEQIGRRGRVINAVSTRGEDWFNDECIAFLVELGIEYKDVTVAEESPPDEYARLEATKSDAPAVVLLTGLMRKADRLTLQFCIKNVSHSLFQTALALHELAYYHLGIADQNGKVLEPFRRVHGVNEPGDTQIALEPQATHFVTINLDLTSNSLHSSLGYYMLEPEGFYQLWFECDSVEGVIESPSIWFSLRAIPEQVGT